MPVQTTYTLAPPTGYAGMIVRGDIVISRRNGEAAAEVPFGYAVVPHATDEDKAVLPSANNQKVLGLIGRSQFHAPDIELGTTGLKPGTNMNVVVRGAMLVLAEDAAALLDRGYVRCTAGGDATEKVGGIAPAAEGVETIDTSNQIQFQAAVAAQSLVLVEVDFTRKA